MSNGFKNILGVKWV